MVAHIVLFRPKSDLQSADKDAMFEALTSAATKIPSVRRFHVGTRITHGRGYELLMKESFPFAAVIEFDDVSGLKMYLEHPDHQKLGELFFKYLDAGLVYDYEMVKAGSGTADL